jgi:NAD(P)-dependent dehydrogenase (short-subunit alcohol dehydrogenase family)
LPTGYSEVLLDVCASAADDLGDSDWDDAMTVNLRAPFFLTRALHGKLAAASTADRPSKVINLASIDAIRLNATPAYSYTASKAGLVLLTRRMAADLIHDDIAVTAISPGSFATAINVRALEHGDELAANNPSGRIGRDEDMQGVAIYLASRVGDWVVSENIVVDGGLGLAKLGT